MQTSNVELCRASELFISTVSIFLSNSEKCGTEFSDRSYTLWF